MTCTWSTYTTREAWLSARRHTIGSSDAPVILGLGHMAESGASKSLFELWAEKTGRLTDGGKDSLRLRLGRQAEQLVSDELGAALQDVDAGVEPAGPIYWEHSDSDPFAVRSPPIALCVNGGRSATPDRVLVPANADRVLMAQESDPGGGKWRLWLLPYPPAELKTVEAIAADDWSPKEPSRYSLVQLHHQMGVMDVDHGYIAALVGWGTFYHYRIACNADLLEVIWEAEDRFREYVIRDIPPDPDGSESTRRALKKIYPTDTGAEVVLTGWSERYERFRLAVETVKEWERERDEFKAALALEMKDASYALLTDPVGAPLARFSYTTRAGYHVEGFDVAPTRTGPTERKLTKKGRR